MEHVLRNFTLVKTHTMFSSIQYTKFRYNRSRTHRKMNASRNQLNVTQEHFDETKYCLPQRGALYLRNLTFFISRPWKPGRRVPFLLCRSCFITYMLCCTLCSIPPYVLNQYTDIMCTFAC